MSYQYEIVIGDGVVSQNLTAAPESVGGDAEKIIIQSGGTLELGTVKAGGYLIGTFGAVAENLVTETGAVVALESATGSGLMFQGAATTIAVDTLYWNGKLIHGEAVDGVISGVSSTDPFRFCIGTGITVSDARLTSGTRIYARGDAVISSSVILESGNIGFRDNAVGRDIVVGGEGVAQFLATLQVGGLAVYDTVISQGGQANVRTYASGMTINRGGRAVIYSGGMLENAVVFSGGSILMSGGLLSGGAMSSGAAITISGGVFSGGVAEYGALVDVTDGAVISDGRITGSNSYSDNHVRIRDLGVAREMKISGARMVVSSGGEAHHTEVYGGGLGVGGRSYDTVVYGGFEQIYTGGSGIRTVFSGGYGSVYAGGLMSGGIIRNGNLYIYGTALTMTISAGMMHLCGTGLVDEVRVEGGGKFTVSNGNAKNAVIRSGAVVTVSGGALSYGTIESGATVKVYTGGTIDGFEITGGGAYQETINVYAGGLARNIKVGAARLFASDGGVVESSVIIAGVQGLYNRAVARGTVIRTGGAENVYAYSYDATISGGRQDVYAGGSAIGTVILGGYQNVRVDAAASNTVIRGGYQTLSGTAVDTVIFAGAYQTVSGTASGAVLSGGTQSITATGTASDTVIKTGGSANIVTGGKLHNVTISSGGYLNVANYGAAATITGDVIFDLTDVRGGLNTYLVNSALFGMTNATRIIRASEDTAPTEYYIAADGGAVANSYKFDLDIDGNVYTVTRGFSIIDPFSKLTYQCTSNSVSGKTDVRLKTTANGHTIAAVGIAESLMTSGAVLNTSDREARWSETTGATTGNIFLTSGMSAGNAWLEINGYEGAATNLFGAAKNQNFTGKVNIAAQTGTIKNIAGGAGLGGSVAGVMFTVADGMSITGAVYAGGMGDVTGKTETLIEGGTFGGNIFAGALCNYVANTTATNTGAINLTVDGGTFANNLYAGAAVKAGAATSVVHTAGDITVKLNDGEATKSNFCLYGGGYAVGTAAGKTVYTAGNVDIAINGGSWGQYLSGRGIFGGVYADKVAASVEDVTISVTGGKMGNIYGGGWAQNGGNSTVGDVTITIAGDANVANVFGGGSYSSTSGGATSVGSVTIRVSGGSIANNIFAAGQNEFSTVTGDVSVTFTGANDYSCNVYGYGVQSSATNANDKTLAFDGFTGTLSGAVGGFDAIGFTGNTATTLAGAIDNTDWTFDYTARTLDTAALTLNGGTFAGDDLTLKLAASAAPADWNIAAGLADTAVGFDYAVYIGDTALEFTDGKVASGDYAGWGFALEDSTLKFKQLA